MCYHFPHSMMAIWVFRETTNIWLILSLPFTSMSQAVCGKTQNIDTITSTLFTQKRIYLITKAISTNFLQLSWSFLSFKETIRFLKITFLIYFCFHHSLLWSVGPDYTVFHPHEHLVLLDLASHTENGVIVQTSRIMIQPGF